MRLRAKRIQVGVINPDLFRLDPRPGRPVVDDREARLAQEGKEVQVRRRIDVDLDGGAAVPAVVTRGRGRDRCRRARKKKYP